MSGGQAVAGILAAALLVCGPLARAESDHKKDAGSPKPGATASPTPKFNVPIPVDHGAVWVKLPYYDIRGRLQMYFYIQKAFRVDTGHLEMKNAYMQTYDDRQAPDATVFMTRCVLDLDTRIVTSDVPVVVRRSDFQIVGQKMVFNTQTRAGHMTGHVKMLIYNRQEMAKPTPSPGPSGSGAPAAPSSSAIPKPGATP